MDITGKIIAALQPRSGTSARTGNTWKSQDFVIETHDQYPRKCVFTVFGEDRLNEMNLQVGAEVTVSFDIDAHEYQGRWFNSIRAWKVERIDPNAVAQAPVQPAPFGQPAPMPQSQPAAPAASAPEAAPFPPQPESGSEDDLPF